MVGMFALAGAVIGFIPFGSFILIPMEMLMLYLIMERYNKFAFVDFIVVSAMIATFSVVLKGLASLLHFIPIVGQFSNSIIAAGFIFILGTLAEKHYGKSNSGKSSD